MKRVAVLLLLPVAFFWLFGSFSKSHGPGITAPNAPFQEIIHPAQPFPFKDHVIYRLALFEIEARVLSKKRYNWGRESELSPLDLALGWGAMSDENVLDHFSISQGGRWYRWRYSELPIPKHEVIYSSANMHMIPADKHVKKQLKKVREGEVLRLKGYLVEANGHDGWRWRSSLSREDAGDGACEIVYVEEVEIVKAGSWF